LIIDPIDIQEKKRAAQRRLRAQRAKAGELRGRVVAISLICFVLLWGIVFVQMATGNDPVLGDSSSAIAKGSTHAHRPPARSTVESGASTDSEAEAATEAEPVEEEFVEEEPAFEEEFVEEAAPEEEFVEEEPAPVTTSQS
jgi:cytoskeletal protein RodZ